MLAIIAKIIFKIITFVVFAIIGWFIGIAISIISVKAIEKLFDLKDFFTTKKETKTL